MGLWDLLTGASPGAQVGEAGSKVVGGVFDGLKGIIEEFHLAPEAEMKLQLALEAQKLEFYKAQTNDVQSARAMQMATRSIWPGLISTIMLVGFFAGGAALLIHGMPVTDANGFIVLTLFVQTLVSGVNFVMGYWLGSSSGSQAKSELLFRSSPAVEKT